MVLSCTGMNGITRSPQLRLVVLPLVELLRAAVGGWCLRVLCGTGGLSRVDVRADALYQGRPRRHDPAFGKHVAEASARQDGTLWGHLRRNLPDGHFADDAILTLQGHTCLTCNHVRHGWAVAGRAAP